MTMTLTVTDYNELAAECLKQGRAALDEGKGVRAATLADEAIFYMRQAHAIEEA